LNLYLTQAVAYDDAKAGAAVAVQSFGDFQNFNPSASGGFWPPMAAFMATVLSRLVPRRKPRTLKSCFAMKSSRCLKPKAKSKIRK